MLIVRPLRLDAKCHYLYRAVDKHGKTVDFLLRRDRGIAVAQEFFRKALASTLPRVPRKVTLDGHVPSRRALWLLRREHPCWRNVNVRTNKYLNNLIEQDHRAIKRRCASMAGFRSFANATITIAGIELAHRIRKGQFSLGRRPEYPALHHSYWAAPLIARTLKKGRNTDSVLRNFKAPVSPELSSKGTQFSCRLTL
jgi:transposase-like protein